MLRMLNFGINISFAANPFYMYFTSFTMAVFTYLWGWSEIYPGLSSGLIVFLLLTFALFIIAGLYFEGKKHFLYDHPLQSSALNDIVFYLIIFLGIINILIAGYIPLFDKSHNYREFGAPVIDVLFNTLCIFFSLVFLQLFLEKKENRFAGYYIIILIFQILLFRRATIVWIISSSLFLVILQKKRILLHYLIAGVMIIPLLSFLFGLFGNKRSDLTREKVVDRLGTSADFENSGISHNHYLTYLYISSPLANLQKNISPGDNFNGRGDLKDLFFYCMVPPSITMRLEKKLKLSPPAHKLIAPELIVGTCFMISYCTMGWTGMILQLLFIFCFFLVNLILLHRWNTFALISVSLLSASASLLIFDNILIRLDVILMLFLYPVLFHFIYKIAGVRAASINSTG